MKNKSILQSLRFLTLLGLMVLGIGNAWGGNYVKVTSTSDLTVGSQFIIVSGSTYAVKNEMNGTNGLKLVSVTLNTDKSISFESTANIAEFTLGGNSTDGYTLLLNTSYFSANGSNNKSRLLTTKSTSGESDFTISFNSSSGSLILTTKQSTGRTLRANGTTDVRFYSTNSGNVVYLYKKNSSGDPLATPTGLTVGTLTATGTTLSWNTVENAGSYKVEYKVSSASQWTAVSPNPTTTTCNLTDLTPETTYAWQVTAIPTNTSQYSNSEAASGTNFTTAALQSYSVTWYVNGQTYTEGGPTTSVKEGSKVTTLPTEPTISGKTFMGWTTSPIDGTQASAPSPLFKTAGNAPEVSSVTNYYAVFATATAGGTKWTKTAASAVTAGTYAIITTDGHAFNGTISSGHGQVTSTAFSFTDNVATSAPEGTLDITIAASGSGYTMYNADKGYLYASAASAGKLAWHSTENSYWSYASSNWKYASNSAYLRSYNNSSIRTYSANNGDVLQFAKKESGTTYSDYCTQVATKLTAPSNLQSTNVSFKEATLSWTAVSNASSYTVKYKKSADAEYTTVASLSTNLCTLSGLDVSTNYVWSVMAVGDGTNYTSSDYATEVNFTTSTPTLTSLTVSGTPTTKTYVAGQALNPAGLVVTGTYSDESQKTITEGITWLFDPETLSVENTTCDVYAGVGSVMSETAHTVTGLTVTASKTLTSVVVSGTPTKSVYEVGEVFNPAGLTVTAYYSDGSDTDVSSSSSFAYSQEALAYGTTSIDVTATYNETTSVVYACPITVNKKTASIIIADIELNKDEKKTISAETTPSGLTLTYSITSGSTYISLEGNEITGVAGGTAVVNAHYDGNEEYASADKSFNVTVIEAATITLKDKGEQYGSVINTYVGANVKTALTGVNDPETRTTMTDYTFQGWAQNNSITTPNIITDETTVSGNMTLYAIYGKKEEDKITWEVEDLAKLTSSDVFVITGKNSSGIYSMSNDNGASKAPKATTVTIENSKITSTVNDDLKWNIVGNGTDGYTFYSNSSKSTWLYCINDNNGVRVGSSNVDSTFVLDNSGYLKHVGTSRYVGIYNSSDWRCYTSPTATNIAGQTFAFYKQVVEPGKTTYDFEDTDRSLTVTYAANGAEGDVPVCTTLYAIGETHTLLEPTNLTKTGNTFAHWTTDQAGEGTHYAVGSSYTFGANSVTFYAQWTPNLYNVSVGEVNGAEVTATYNTSETIAEGNNANIPYGTVVTLIATGLGANQQIVWDVVGATVSPAVGTGATFTVGTSDVTINATVQNVSRYNLVTSTDDLVAGGQYILVSVKGDGTTYMANGAFSENKKYLEDESIETPVGGVITTTSTAIVPFVLGGDAKNGWFLNNKQGQFAVSGNDMALIDYTAYGTAKWNISFNSGDDKYAIIKAVDGQRFIQYNYTSERFNTYASTYTSGSMIYLYKLNETASTGTFSTPSTEVYTTFYSKDEFLMPEGAQGGVVNQKNGTTVVVDYKFPAGSIVPTKTPLVIKGTANTQYTFIKTKLGCIEYSYTNYLMGVPYEIPTEGYLTVAPDEEDYYFYKLTYNNSTDKKIGFYWGADGGDAFIMKTAGKAYLALPQSAGIKGISLEDLETGINVIEADIDVDSNDVIYNLGGQKLNKLQKGINIVNGRKVYVK